MGSLYRVELKVVVDMVMPIRFLQGPLVGYFLPIRVARKINSWAQGTVRDHHCDAFRFIPFCLHTKDGTCWWHEQFASLSGP